MVTLRHKTPSDIAPSEHKHNSEYVDLQSPRFRPQTACYKYNDI